MVSHLIYFLREKGGRKDINHTTGIRHIAWVKRELEEKIACRIGRGRFKLSR